MSMITVRKWRVEGKLYDDLSEAIKDKKEGTVVEQVSVLSEPPEYEDILKSRRDKKSKEGK